MASKRARLPAPPSGAHGAPPPLSSSSSASSSSAAASASAPGEAVAVPAAPGPPGVWPMFARGLPRALAEHALEWLSLVEYAALHRASRGLAAAVERALARAGRLALDDAPPPFAGAPQVGLGLAARHAAAARELDLAPAWPHDVGASRHVQQAADAALAVLGRCRGSLEAVRLQACLRTHANLLALAACPRLRAASLVTVDAERADAAVAAAAARRLAATCRQLRELELPCDLLQPALAAEVLAALPPLRSLRLAAAPGPLLARLAGSATHLAGAAAEQWPRLKQLSVEFDEADGDPSSEEGDAAVGALQRLLARCGRLRTLCADLGALVGLHDGALAGPLAAFGWEAPRLRHLTWRQRLAPQVLGACRAPQLRTATLRGVASDLVAALVRQAPRLEELRAEVARRAPRPPSGAPGVLRAALAAAPALRVLTLAGVRVSDATLAEMADAWTHLVELELTLAPVWRWATVRRLLVAHAATLRRVCLFSEDAAPAPEPEPPAGAAAAAAAAAGTGDSKRAPGPPPHEAAEAAGAGAAAGTVTFPRLAELDLPSTSAAHVDLRAFVLPRVRAWRCDLADFAGPAPTTLPRQFPGLRELRLDCGVPFEREEQPACAPPPPPPPETEWALRRLTLFAEGRALALGGTRLADFLARAPRLQRLALRDAKCGALDWAALRVLVAQGGLARLRAVELHNTTTAAGEDGRVEEGALADFLAACPALRTAWLPGVSEARLALIAASRPGLRHKLSRADTPPP